MRHGLRMEQVLLPQTKRLAVDRLHATKQSEQLRSLEEANSSMRPQLVLACLSCRHCRIWFTQAMRLLPLRAFAVELCHSSSISSQQTSRGLRLCQRQLQLVSQSQTRVMILEVLMCREKSPFWRVSVDLTWS